MCLKPEHKIQSSNGKLQLSLEMTPKLLKPLVKDWVPRAFIVSFKVSLNLLHQHIQVFQFLFS